MLDLTLREISYKTINHLCYIKSNDITQPAGHTYQQATFQVGRSSLEQQSHLGVVLAITIAIFVPLEPWIGAWNGKKGP